LACLTEGFLSVVAHHSRAKFKLALGLELFHISSMNDVNWRHFPSSTYPAPECLSVVDVVRRNQSKFRLDEKDSLTSDEVLSILRDDLAASGFKVESSKRKDDKLPQVVTWGENGKPDKSFHVDAFHEEAGVVVEIEAGQAVANHRFLKDFFEACALQKANHLVIAVRMEYKKSKDYAIICKFFESIYASNRMTFPLKGLLIIGYHVH